jgi:hypothetical protein
MTFWPELNKIEYASENNDDEGSSAIVLLVLSPEGTVLVIVLESYENRSIVLS